MIRYLTAGESHGKQLTGIVEGVPAGLSLPKEVIDLHMARRQKGYGRGGRMAFEHDHIDITSGVRFGETIGGPITLHLANRAFEKDDSNWPHVMSVDPVENQQAIEDVTLPRPGHADLTGAQKYGFEDIRPVIERSSARETAMRVACCSVARQFLSELGIQIGGHMVRIGEAGYDSWEASREAAEGVLAQGADELREAADESEVRCLDALISKAMVDHIKVIRKEGSSLGGVYEIVVTGLPAGLGSYVHWDRKLDGQLAQAIMGTQAMKGVEIGLGFESGARRGHDVHDAIGHDGGQFRRQTNRSGGIEGGMTTGEPLILRGVMKPIPTLLKPLPTADLKTKKEQETRYERSDVCAAPRAIVVAESVIAPVLANAVLEKFGGDSMGEIKKRWTLSR
ncbi:MAG: chorismate synthase [Bacteroidetes bacterium]|nr:chorismate synthase [Bacteroidota bacterium]